MTQRKDVADNREQAADSPKQAAQDIKDYLLTYQNDAEKREKQLLLGNILELAQKVYSGEDDSYFKQYLIYPNSRIRNPALKEAIDRYKNCSEEQFPRFVIFVDLLRTGECESTSLNSFIIDQLLVATGKYHPIKDDKQLDAGGLLSGDHRENVRERVRRIFITKAQQCIADTEEKCKKEERRLELTAKVTSHVEPGRLMLTKTLIEELDRVLKGKNEKPLAQGNKLDSKLLADRHAMLSAAFSKKAALISPLPVSYEETVVAVLQPPEDRPMPEPQVHSKNERGKLNQNPAFAASLDVIGGFFAKKYATKKAARVQDKFADEFAVIAKHFGAKA